MKVELIERKNTIIITASNPELFILYRFMDILENHMGYASNSIFEEDGKNIIYIDGGYDEAELFEDILYELKIDLAYEPDDKLLLLYNKEEYDTEEPYEYRDYTYYEDYDYIS